MKKKILCMLGFHKWNKPVKISHGFTSNIVDVKKTCKFCKKTKRWIEIKK